MEYKEQRIIIPNTVDVAGIDYTIREIKGLADDHNLGGQIIYHKSDIKIDADMSESKKKQIFIHELTHAIFHEAGYEEQDEDMINRLSIVLYQVLKNNKLYFGR